MVLELKMRKICAKFVPRVLREDQKERRCHDSREMVELVNSDPAVLDALVTCDESWIYCYDPETKRQSSHWHFHQDNAPVHNSILVTDYLTKMGIKTVPHPPYSPDLAPSDFWLFPKLKENLRSCHYETIEEMKEAVTKVIDTLAQEDFHGAFQKLLERYNKCIAVRGDYFTGD